MNPDDPDVGPIPAVRGKYNDVTERVIGVFNGVYNKLEDGFLEAGY
jgi:hypothetical protein